MRGSIGGCWGGLVLAICAACSADGNGRDPTGVTVGFGSDTTAGAGTSADSATDGSATAADGTATTTGATGTPTDSGFHFDVGGMGTTGGEGSSCSGDLQSVLDAAGQVIETCPADQGCANGVCVPACDAAGLSQGSVGCGYVTPYPPFFQNASPGVSYTGACHALMIANTWGRPAQLTLELNGVPYDALQHARIPTGVGPAVSYDPVPATGIPVGQVAILFLSHVPTSNHPAGGSLACPVEPAYIGDIAVHGTGQGAAFELGSDTPVTVYDILPFGGASSYLPSASLLFPTTAWGDNYLLATPHLANASGKKWALVVAQADDTTVTFNTSAAVDGGSIAPPPPGVATQYTIDRGEFIQWSASAELGGGVLLSDKNIGVYTGHTYLNAPTADSNGGPQDSSHQQITHVNALASEYVSFGIPTRLQSFGPESVLYRLVGVVDGTTLSYDTGTPPGAPVTLQQGELVEFQTRDSFVVTSQDEDHPFAFTQYMSGSISDGAAQGGCFGSPCNLGDTDWITLVPPAQFLSRYAFFIDPTYGVTSVSIVRVAGPTGFEDVTLACMADAVSGWQPVGVSDIYEVAHVDLHRGGVGPCATSQQEASSLQPFGMTVWGVDRDASYGYPAGGNAQTINTVAVPTG